MRNKNIFANFSRPSGFDWDAPSNALEAWSKLENGPQASESVDASVIDILDVIGEDYWSGNGFTEKKLGALLRKAGENTDITVNINSPGGDVFQGVAIYSRLKAHKGNVQVNIQGIAASAASFIAMAGDEITMSTGSMIMVHNAWGIIIGNRHDMADAVDTFGKIDESMAEIYTKRTGMDKKAIVDLMDGATDGTFMTVAESIANGFADKELDAIEPSDKVSNKLPEDVVAKRQVEAALAKEGVTRKKRADIMKNLVGTRDAIDNTERDAGKTEELAKALSNALAVFKS